MYNINSILLLPPQLFAKNDIPDDLTILSPAQAGSQLHNFFQAQEYKEHNTETRSIFHRQRYRIWQDIIDCDETISPQASLYRALLKKSQTTDQLCFLTGNYLVCICPQLTARTKYAFVHNYNGPTKEMITNDRHSRGFSLAEGQDKEVSELCEQRFIGDIYCQIWEICPKEFLTPDTKAMQDRQAALASFDTGWTFRLRRRTR